MPVQITGFLYACLLLYTRVARAFYLFNDSFVSKLHHIAVITHIVWELAMRHFDAFSYNHYWESFSVFYYNIWLQIINQHFNYVLLASGGEIPSADVSYATSLYGRIYVYTMHALSDNLVTWPSRIVHIKSGGKNSDLNFTVEQTWNRLTKWCAINNMMKYEYADADKYDEVAHSLMFDNKLHTHQLKTQQNEWRFCDA